MNRKKSKFNKFLLLLSFDFGLASSIWCSRCSDVASQSHARSSDSRHSERECSIIHRYYNGENTAAAQRSKFFYSLSRKFFIFSTLFSDAFSVLRVDPVSTPIFTRRLQRKISIFHASLWVLSWNFFHIVKIPFSDHRCTPHTCTQLEYEKGSRKNCSEKYFKVLSGVVGGLNKQFNSRFHLFLLFRWEHRKRLRILCSCRQW